MKHGHVNGTKKERRPRKDEATRLTAMGQAIAATWGGKMPPQPLVWTTPSAK